MGDEGGEIKRQDDTGNVAQLGKAMDAVEVSVFREATSDFEIELYYLPPE